ncbi:paired immunoglobulin-like type 2 receptor beta [Scyliorhinus torazame]|uniref:paired immunoglobulin-like type 2 receptor beta n=1 Tax=Scyliorhinus torazame TaxID=75743 RepID=UPI003B5CA91A
MDSALRLILLCLSIGMINGNDFRVTQPRSLEGFVGSSVDIPCSFTYPESFNPTKIDICWRRHGFHGRFIFNVSKPYTHPDYRGRIEFLGFPYRDRTGTIRINHLKQSDQNRYFCRVESTGDYSEKWQSLVGTELIVGARRPLSTTAQLISSVTAVSSRDGAARGDKLEPGEILITRSPLALAILAIVWLFGIYLMKTQQVTGYFTYKSCSVKFFSGKRNRTLSVIPPSICKVIVDEKGHLAELISSIGMMHEQMY